MRPPARFLHALAQALSTMGLYKDGHPARERAAETVHERILELQEDQVLNEFTFLPGQVVHGGRPVRELREWDWSVRLAKLGVERIEFTGPVNRDDLDWFLEDLLARLSEQPIPSAEIRQMRETSIRYGLAAMKDDDPDGERDGDEVLATATLGFTLSDEADTVRWLHGELRDGKDLKLLEAEAVVRSLSVAMHGDQEFLVPLLRLKQFDQYTTTHALNVSVLAMALAEQIGLTPPEVRAFGISGLLHDLGKTTIPDEILNKPGKLTDEEREIMNSHTVEGARLIMEKDHHLDLAAVVAYEHHIRIDRGGYPTLAFPRHCHQCSNLVHVCDVYDALRTHRPYRDAWEQDRVLDYIEERAGSEFEPELARVFVEMMRKMEGRVVELEEEDEAVEVEADWEKDIRYLDPESGAEEGKEVVESEGREGAEEG
jgi:putative nucleotidyltransferase with HDIG domain